MIERTPKESRRIDVLHTSHLKRPTHLPARFGLFALLVGLLLPVSPASYARQTGPDAPHLVYSSYVGRDGVGDLAVAPDGTIIIVTTNSPFDATVMRLSADCKQVLGQRTIKGVYYARALAVGNDGSIYVVGEAYAQTGLETVRPFQASPKGEFQGFVAKVSADAKQLLFCSYLGGSRSDSFTEDTANDVAVDDDGLMYVVGTTQAYNNDFPLVNPTQATFGGGYSDGFVSIVDADAGSLVFSTYVGEDGDDDIKSVAVDPTTGTFYAGEFSLANGARRGGIDCDEAVRRIVQWRQEAGVPFGPAVFAADCVHNRYDDSLLRLIVGPDDLRYPVDVHSDIGANPGARPELGGADLVISVYNDKGKLLRSTAFGGPADEYPTRGVVDSARGILYFTGEADGVGLPTVNPFQATYGGGGSDGFVAAFDLTTLQPVFSSYIGGSGRDGPGSIALDADGNILLCGGTGSADFPLTADATQPHLAGLGAGFLMKISALGDLVPDFGIAVDPSTLTLVRGQTGTLTVNIGRTGGFTGKVTVTAPDTKALKVKLTPASATTNDASVTVKVKVKKKAAPATTDLVFTGKDTDGRERTATLALTIQ